MPSTYEKIATTTLGSATATVTLSSIPATYTDLVLISSVLGTTGVTSNVMAYVNSDTATNYSTTYFYADGGSAGSGRSSNASRIFLGQLISYAETNKPVFCMTHFQGYSNTTTYKTIFSRGNSPTTDVDMMVGMWRSTSAITSITIRFDVGNLQSGSTFTVYGIKAA
jgi:hypothetical protein